MILPLKNCHPKSQPNGPIKGPPTPAPLRNLPFNLSNLGSLNLFFGNMPLTALLSTSPPPHFRTILSILMTFKLPGRVVWL